METVGPDVTDLPVGDQVYGVTNPRFAEAKSIGVEICEA
jgi:hypothetical protein